MKRHKNKIIAGGIIAVILAFAFWYGGDTPQPRMWTPGHEESINTLNVMDIADKPTKEEKTIKAVSEIPIKNTHEADGKENKSQSTDNALTPSYEKEALDKRSATQNPNTAVQNGDEKHSVKNSTSVNEQTCKDIYMTEPSAEDKPTPTEPQDLVISDKELTCTLSVRCDTVLQNIALLDKEKVDIVPKDGIIFEETTVTFREGESVFDLLVREMKKNKIHMEFENTPIYNSGYIEGIGNLYEFDLGELSGWMYRVNDWFPNYGCSRYQLKAGDKVEWVYTCDLGKDVGGYNASRGNGHN